MSSPIEINAIDILPLSPTENIMENRSFPANNDGLFSKMSDFKEGIISVRVKPIFA